ncbi:hypothetical protein [Novosphingobium sp. SG720]|uniref:Pepco domain-containing protein n=1 Tax=Novosphingobium sp. SG720 TaxID=2586998 RepID=UPI0014467509|nr:hypothetical protein [Novosphingobium sp. SG720]NKJ44634.1 hypothetical protein [Novosphingobium sp. SG720]
MADESREDWELSIFVPEDTTAIEVTPDDAVGEHSLRDLLSGAKRVTRVGAVEIQAQWVRTVDALMKLSSTIANRSKEWTIDEIEVGLTLSAKGELLFIAEAGAEASIKFTLKRRLDAGAAANPPAALP